MLVKVLNKKTGLVHEVTTLAWEILQVSPDASNYVLVGPEDAAQDAGQEDRSSARRGAKKIDLQPIDPPSTN